MSDNLPQQPGHNGYDQQDHTQPYGIPQQQGQQNTPYQQNQYQQNPQQGYGQQQQQYMPPQNQQDQYQQNQQSQAPAAPNHFALAFKGVWGAFLDIFKSNPTGAHDRMQQHPLWGWLITVGCGCPVRYGVFEHLCRANFPCRVCCYKRYSEVHFGRVHRR